jgi:hypothetical protein
MYTLDKIAWEILDATADDWENLEQIYQAICFDFSPENYEARGEGAYYLRPTQETVLLEEIADRIPRLVAAGLLTARWGESGDPVTGLNDLSYVWRAWFSMTPEGREVWASSEYAAPA